MTGRNLLTRLLVGAVVLAVLGFLMFCFQVRQDQAAVLTRLGKPVRVIEEPGLFLKWPWPIEAVQHFDTKVSFFESRPSEALTKDKRNVIVFVFTAWQIDDPLLFLQSLGDEENARSKLDALVASARNSLLGQYEFEQLASTDADKLKLDEIETKLTGTVADKALGSFGIAVRKVGISRLALPEANTRFVFERMRTERAQIAAGYRSRGEQEADDIRTQTDVEATLMRAEAERQATELRGKGEADAAKILAAAHGKDPELYDFLRRLEVVRNVSDESTLILDSDSPPFDVLLERPKDNKKTAPVEPMPPNRVRRLPSPPAGTPIPEPASE
jgi:membrane protease subunit HflC